jgi:hypothetical protein
MTTKSYYAYESKYHTQRTSEKTTNSVGDTIVRKTYYSFDYGKQATTDSVFKKLKARNLVIPVSTREWKNGQLIGGTVTLFKDFASNSSDTFINPSKMYALQTSVPLTTVQANENIALADTIITLLPNSYFIEKADFTVNGTTGKVTEQKLANDKNQALVWDNQLSMPLAVVDNAYVSEVAYNSFETTETGNWTLNAASISTDATAPTGAKVYTLSNSISKSSLNSSQKYILSYWQKSGTVTITGGTQTNSLAGRVLNGWTYHEVTITGTTSLTISGGGIIDELRLYPATAQMTTYTYDDLFRMSAQCSVNSTIVHYEYDSINRLLDIKDQYGNIIKVFEYNFGRNARPGN